MELKRVIRAGSFGLDVVACKRGLWRAGDYAASPPVNFTRLCGPGMISGIAKFQARYHIKGEHGQIGPITFAHLETYFDALARSQYTAYHKPAPAPLYVNPFRAAWGLVPERTDQGVDFGGGAGAPIQAVGKMEIVRATTDSGWPGPYGSGSGFNGTGGAIEWVLLEGSHKGERMYLAEYIHLFVRVGQIVQAGERIATFYHDASSGVGIEWGFLRPGSHNPCSSDTSGASTEGGIAAERWLRMLGCPTQQNHGPGSPFNPCGRE